MKTNCIRAMCMWWPPLLILLVSSACGVALTYYGPASFDEPLLLWFRVSGNTEQLAGPQWAAAFWLGLTWLGDTVPRIVIASLTILGLLMLRRWHTALFMAGILLSGIALSTSLKYWVGRPRPQLVTYLDHINSLSYPSGHALNSTLFYLAVALVLSPLLSRRAARWTLYVVAASLSLATGVSRVALGVHYPTDVIAGWIISVAWVWLWFAVAMRYWPKALPQASASR
ncbi:phosphatase PAP2 family protein [Candidatus Nitrotoga sp. M5]|uniref:phosphatase PAP2 family protein n=1 Tax=Candidatus Nitrotoga sp. M5 TaxID=2890409 RepID=UPI001EF384BD|nr:phosphatase PAP2 family protein [Candidatus Nitrotoga sp. M5]CAH1386692.1 acidPPc domain-containing protein [Candidatus Nitrotoga sp. M5]